jgi:c-di-GMP-binding flagellar brake protein YcgR
MLNYIKELKNLYEYYWVIIEDSLSNNVFQGIIQKFTAKQLVVLHKENITIPTGEKVQINLYNPSKGLIIYEAIVQHTLENKIVFDNIVFLRNRQRRSNGRIIVNIPLKISTIKKSSGEMLKLEKPIMMTGKNISGSGILLQCNLNIPDDVIFIVELPINDSLINITANITRKYKKNGLYYYGCHFYMLSEENKLVLKRFISQNQLQQAYYKKPAY